MILKVRKSFAKNGSRIKIPGSKSHTIRALFIASLADGESVITNPLISEDIISASNVCKSFGAGIREFNNNDNDAAIMYIQGFNGKPTIPEDVLDIGNSGTTLRLGLSLAALAEGYSVFTGDEQIRKRKLDSLIEALNSLGAQAFSTQNNGMAPVLVKGRMKGGKTTLDAYTSQYLSSLLISCPLLEKNTEIYITRLNEVPYAEMTLWWLSKQGIKYENKGFKEIFIPGRQRYKAFRSSISGDFSSATFMMVLAAISGREIILENLDMEDPQGDKLVLSILEDMGAKVNFADSLISIKGEGLVGREIDMNSIPDALPAMAVAGCFAEGETKLLNVPQARLKETDRIAIICQELRKMGADIAELPEGLIIRKSDLIGSEVKGHKDHRIVMALAIAGLNAKGSTVIDTAESADITFPGFTRILKKIGCSSEKLQ